MPETGESKQQTFDRGYTAGGIAEQLARHDQHFLTINGSIERTATALEALRSDVRALQEQLVADAATRIMLAAALKEAEQKRISASEERYSPYARAFAVVAVLGTLIATFFTIYQFTNN